MARKRDKLGIIRDILSTLKGRSKIGPTRLLHSSNLSPQMFKEYVDLLLEKSFMEEKVSDKKRYFVLSGKGQEFLNEYRSIEETIKSFGL